jgi:23S rRNA (guanosine2251-2'-O)-methyltransferase
MTTDTIYGRHPVLEALRSETPVKRVLIIEGTPTHGIMDEIIEAAQSRAIPVEWRPRATFAKLVEADANHQGVLAQVPSFKYSTVDAILQIARDRNEPPFLLLLDGIQDVHNLGALIRTAEGAGIHGVIIPERRAVGVTQTVYKSSAGAVLHLPIAQVTNITQTMKQLQTRENIWFVGLDMGGKVPYYRTNLKGALGIVVGAEGKGLGRLIAESCDFLVELPMRGKVDSLNASVAGAILMYEAVRQRQAS